MKKTMLIIAVCAVVIGLTLSFGAFAAAGFNYMELSSLNYETNGYRVDEDFDNIHIDIGVSDITIVRAEDGLCRVESFEPENYAHLVEVQDGTLVIKPNYDRNWFGDLGFFRDMHMTLYLPKEQYDRLEVETDTGNVELKDDFQFRSVLADTSTGGIWWWNAKATEQLALKSNTGDIYLLNTQCGDVKISTSTGNVDVADTVAGSIDVSVSTGRVNVDRSDAAGIWIETSTGDISCRFLSEKRFITESSTGDVRVPESGNGDECHLKTSTGDIVAEIIGKK